MHNKKALRIFLALAAAAVLAVGMTACGGSGDDTNTDVAVESEVVSETTSSDENGGFLITPENTETEDVLVYENFTGGSISKDNKIYFDISEIKMTEKGLEIHYKAGGTHQGYSSYIMLYNVHINGCKVNVEYYAGDKEQESMGKNNTGDAELPLYVLIPAAELNMYDITEWQSLEFDFDAGYEAYGSISSEYEESYRLFAGASHEIIPYDVMTDEDAVKIMDDSICSAFITDMRWENDGKVRVYTVQFVNRTGKDVNFNFETITVDGEEIDFTINEQYRNNWWIDANSTSKVDIRWRNNSKLDLSKGVSFDVSYEIDYEKYAKYSTTIPEA